MGRKRIIQLGENPSNVYNFGSTSVDNALLAIRRENREIADHLEYIRSGIEVIDQTLRGLQKTNVSVLTGVRGSGKSTILAQIILTAINDGHNVVCYSGELNNKKYWIQSKSESMKNWIILTKLWIDLCMKSKVL